MKKLLLKGEKIMAESNKLFADLFLEKGGKLYQGAVKRANTKVLKAETKIEEIKEQENQIAEQKAAKKAQRKAEKANKPSLGQRVSNLLFKEEESDRIFLTDPVFLDKEFKEYSKKFSGRDLLNRNYDGSVLYVKHEGNALRVISANKFEMDQDDVDYVQDEVVVLLHTEYEDFYVRYPMSF